MRLISVGYIFLIFAIHPLLRGVRGETAAADELHQRAAQSYRAEDWQTAIDSWLRFVTLFPDDVRVPSARFFLGEAYLQAGRPGQAATSFEEYLEAVAGQDHASAVRAKFRIGEAAFLSGDVDKAESVLCAFCDQHPSDPLVRYALPYRISMAYQRGNDAEVFRMVSALRTLHPVANCEAEFLAVMSHQRLGQLAQAQEICRRMESTPQLAKCNSISRFSLLDAEITRLEEGPAGALRKFQRLAMSNGPPALRSRAMLNVAECHAALGDTLTAIQWYAAIIVGLPDEPEADTAAGKIHELRECLITTS